MRHEGKLWGAPRGIGAMGTGESGEVMLSMTSAWRQINLHQ
jgi:hypothetical protein